MDRRRADVGLLKPGFRLTCVGAAVHFPGMRAFVPSATSHVVQGPLTVGFFGLILRDLLIGQILGRDYGIAKQWTAAAAAASVVGALSVLTRALRHKSP